jgi:Uma2 family endonuclease
MNTAKKISAPARSKAKPAPKAGEGFKPFTYREYKNWGEDIRCELIDGIVYLIAPPSGFHQGISMELGTLFCNFLDDKPCRVFAAPYDVRLFAPIEKEKDDESDQTVLVPDLVVICDRKKRQKEGCHGAPDLVIEILSPSNRRLDLKLKYDKYLQAGVKEYWVIDPVKRTLIVYTLCVEEGESFYIPATYTGDETVKVGIFKDQFSVNLKELFKKAGRYEL